MVARNLRSGCDEFASYCGKTLITSLSHTRSPLQRNHESSNDVAMSKTSLIKHDRTAKLSSASLRTYFDDSGFGKYLPHLCLIHLRYFPSHRLIIFSRFESLRGHQLTSECFYVWIAKAGWPHRRNKPTTEAGELRLLLGRCMKHFR